MIGLLMMVGVLSGCGGKEIEVVKETQPLTGKLIEEYEVYRDDKTNKPVKHGYYKSYYEVTYYESGKVYREGNFVDGKLDGKLVKYDKEGNITDESCWEMGERVDCP
jgi:antitoxin component YwqK of YwqJK toxin-antitoxin module